MLVDCHTHFWERADQLGRLQLGGGGGTRTGSERPAQPCPDFREYLGREYLAGAAQSRGTAHTTARPDLRTIVLGFRCRHHGVDIPNESVAAFVADQGPRFIGFAGVDPTDRFAVSSVDKAVKLGLRGLVVSPSAQGFHPTDTRAMAVYERAAEAGLPVVFHQGGSFAAQSWMEFARPFLLDEVARTFPTLRMVISHLGYPWVDETVVMLDKHPHVHADICSLIGRPWQAYQCLSLCWNAGVTGKLLFGSDFPYGTVEATVKALYSVNELTRGTALPTIPLRELRGIVERDALALLGLATSAGDSRIDASEDSPEDTAEGADPIEIAGRAADGRLHDPDDSRTPGLGRGLAWTGGSTGADAERRPAMPAPGESAEDGDDELVREMAAVLGVAGRRERHPDEDPVEAALRDAASDDEEGGDDGPGEGSAAAGLAPTWQDRRPAGRETGRSGVHDARRSGDRDDSRDNHDHVGPRAASPTGAPAVAGAVTPTDRPAGRDSRVQSFPPDSSARILHGRRL